MKVAEEILNLILDRAPALLDLDMRAEPLEGAA